MLTIIKRAEAKALGLKRYYNGKPCKHGHHSEKFVSSKGCIECHIVKGELPDVRKSRNDSIERSRAKNKEKNVEKIKRQVKEYGKRNRERLQKIKRERIRLDIEYMAIADQEAYAEHKAQIRIYNKRAWDRIRRLRASEAVPVDDSEDGNE